MNPFSKNSITAGESSSNRMVISSMLQTKFSIVFSLHLVAISKRAPLNPALFVKWRLFYRIDLKPVDPIRLSYLFRMKSLSLRFLIS